MAPPSPGLPPPNVPPWPPLAAITSDINQRFFRGGANAGNTLHDAGLLVHMFDNLEDGRENWHTCHSGWCANRFDHMSCSLINAAMPTLFNYGLGFILSPNAEFVCGFTADGGTQGKQLGGCHSRQRCRTNMWWNCGWSPDQLRDAVSTQLRVNRLGYNEYVVSAMWWEEHLPHTIEAVVCRDKCGRARQVHSAFLQAYDHTALQTPLLYYHGSDKGFTDISSQDFPS
jgi:hypothetical protein